MCLCARGVGRGFIESIVTLLRFIFIKCYLMFFLNTFLQSIISYFHLEFSFALNVSVDTFNFYDFISYHLTPNRPVFTPCLKIYVNDPLLPPSPSYFYIQSFSMTKYVGWTEFVHVYVCVSVPALQPKQQPILIKVYGLENMGQCFFSFSDFECMSI